MLARHYSDLNLHIKVFMKLQQWVLLLFTFLKLTQKFLLCTSAFCSGLTSKLII